MPDVRNSEKEPDKGKRRFINEKVVRQPMSKRQICLRLAMVLFAAIVFGVAAGISFTVARPLAERYLGEEETPSETISIPRDDPADSTPAPTPAPIQTVPETEGEPIEEQVQSALENYRYTVDDLNSMFADLRTQIQTAEKGIVTIHSVQQTLDWFDNPVETAGLYAGVITAKTDQEILILTPDNAVEQADSIKVTLDDMDLDGQVKQKDTTSGMAVVSADISALDENVREKIGVIALGNSYSVREGDLVAAVGSPAGVVHSVDYGFIAYATRSNDVVDGTAKIFYTDIMSDEEKGTFLLNTSGELIGWVRENASETDGRVKEVVGISDYKSVLERMSNGLSAPLFGINGQEVTQSMSDSGLPDGIYVLHAIADGPAYNAGIQNGDIITSMDGNEIATIREFQNFVGDLEVGQIVNVTVERNGREEYTQLQFQVTIGAR